VSEWVDSQRHISTIRLYSATHIGSWWKIHDRRQIKNTDNTETKHNPEKANTAKTKLLRFSCFYDTQPENEVGLFYNVAAAGCGMKLLTLPWSGVSRSLSVHVSCESIRCLWWCLAGNWTVPHWESQRASQGSAWKDCSHRQYADMDQGKQLQAVDTFLLLLWQFFMLCCCNAYCTGILVAFTHSLTH